MNRPHSFNTRTLFKPASQYLRSVSPTRSSSRDSSHRREDSIDDSDLDKEREGFRDLEHGHGHGLGTKAMDTNGRPSRSSQKELTPSSIPLISLSRSPSPYARAGARSTAQSEDEDEFDGLFVGDRDGDAQLSRPLVAKDGEQVRLGEWSRDGSSGRTGMGKGKGKGNRVKRGAGVGMDIFKKGGLGQFFFGTRIGWHVYVGLLVFWVGGCQFGLMLMNRFVLWTGTYK